MYDEDDALMIRLQEGDESAFAVIVGRYQSPLVGFFHKHLRDWHLAEDLSQEVLLRVHNTAWDYLPHGLFKAWLYRVARNLLIDTTRKRAHDALVRSVRPDRKDSEEDGISLVTRLAGEFKLPDDEADQKEFARLIDELLPVIPEDQRFTFILYVYYGLSLPEIAEAMESNLPTTKSRLRLAREKLREKLAARGIVDPLTAG